MLLFTSSGTDELGRAGIAGIVDNKIASALFSSVALAGVSIGSAVVGQKASNLIDALTAMDAVKSITATEIDISSLKGAIVERLENSIKTEVGKVGDEKWKLGIRAIEKIRNAKSDQDLLRIIKEEIVSVIKSSGASGVDAITSDNIGITLDDVRQLLRQTQKRSKSVYDEAIGKSINDFSKDMRDVVGR